MKNITKEDLDLKLSQDSNLISISKSEFGFLLKSLSSEDNLMKSIGGEDENSLSPADFISKSQVYDVMDVYDNGLVKSIKHTELIVLDKDTLEKAQKVYRDNYRNRKLGRVGQPIKGGKTGREKTESKLSGGSEGSQTKPEVKAWANDIINDMNKNINTEGISEKTKSESQFIVSVLKNNLERHPERTLEEAKQAMETSLKDIRKRSRGGGDAYSSIKAAVDSANKKH